MYSTPSFIDGRCLLQALACLVVVGTFSSPKLAATELQGYVEPYRTIRVASDESGTIEEVLVREGQIVTAGQPLVRLNSEVHRALLKIADQHMRAEGQLEATNAELNLKKARLEKLRNLRLEGFSRQEEVDRATTEVAIAEANLLTAREDLIARRLEYEKIKTQIDRRTVTAPVGGVVTLLHKQLGEFVAPNSPELLTLVQIDVLLANFTLANSQLGSLEVGEQYKVRISEPGVTTNATVEFVSPVTDAESGTVLVKLRIENVDGQFRSGERCTLRLGK